MGCGGDHGIQATIMGTGCVQTWLRKTSKKHDVNENMVICNNLLGCTGIIGYPI